jgi:hypothetical protein
MAKDTRTNEIIYVQNLQFGTLFDSGATHSACSTSTAARLHALGITVLPSTFPIRNADGGSMKVRGMLQMKFRVQQQTFKWDFFVVDNLDNEVIIGADFMKPHKVLLDMANSKVIFPDSCETRQINAVYKSMIPENHHVKIQCQISAAQNIQLKPGSLTVTKRREILPGVFLEEVLTKVLNRNRIFVVITNNNPYQVCIKPSQILGETVDIEAKILPVDEAKISAFNTNVTTGQTSTCTPEKEEYLKQNLNCPTEGNLHVQYEELILRNHDVFAKDKYDLGFSDAVSHKINMKNSQPVYIKQFRIPDAHQDVILDHIKEWQNKNVIEECSSPYNSPVFCVPKKGGGLRIVQDCREINKNSFEDKYAIKDVQECIDTIGKSDSSIFSTLDMASGFWQQNLDEASRDFTAFTIPFLNTQFRWSRTTMGLQGAPASFSRLTALVFRGISNVITYIDDLMTHTTDHFQQLQVLQQCFDRMRTYNMKFNINKCVFGATKVNYLGFEISREGISPAKDKLEAVQKFSPPASMTEVRAFIGFCNYFRRMIGNFSRLAAPLINLTKKDSTWKSGTLPEDALTSFNSLKLALCSAPVIGFSKSGGQYILTVDAATSGLGAILTQSVNNNEKVISYWSRTIRQHERNYTPYMLEMTAVCSALEHFHEYLFGKRIIIFTDHKPLLGTSTIQKKTMTRLVEKMNTYDIDLRYKKGCENQGADYLSRHAVFSMTQGDRFSRIRELQNLDEMSKSIITFLTNKTFPQNDYLQRTIIAFAPRCFIRDGVLWFVPSKANKETAVLFTPYSMQRQIISNAHGKPLTGHWAVERTVQRIENSYFWPTLTKDVTEFIRRCTNCQKAARPPQPVELTPWLQAVQPNDRVHVDLYGPLQGDPIYKYVAVLSCAFTKWVEVIPIPNKEAPTVAKAIFEEWICRRGVMKLLVSDGGKEFANNILEELCKLMQCDKHVVSPYHPMANGQVERFNRDMRKYLMTILEETSDWVSFLKPLQFAHNSALNKSTLFTPHYLTFLQHPRLPDSLDSTAVNYKETYSSEAFKRLQYAHRLVYRNNEEARNAYTANYNRKIRARHFEVGDEVLVIFPVPPHVANKKLSTIWKGPFSITRLLPNQVIEFKSSARSKPQIVHVNRIRLFNHLEDSITNSDPTAQDIQQKIPSTQAKSATKHVRFSDDDEDEEDYIYDDNNIAGPIVQPQLQEPVPPPQVDPLPAAQPAPIQQGGANRLAEELFRRSTRSRGPVPDQDLPHRPMEYKKYTRK